MPTHFYTIFRFGAMGGRGGAGVPLPIGRLCSHLGDWEFILGGAGTIRRGVNLSSLGLCM